MYSKMIKKHKGLLVLILMVIFFVCCVVMETTLSSIKINLKL
jgi:hypothetical protein